MRLKIDQLYYGGVPVPFAASWTAENEFTIGALPWNLDQPAICQNNARGEGKPDFGKPHWDRQRLAVHLGLCDLCARPLAGRTKISLSHAKPRVGAGLGLVIMQIEPMLHKECARESLKHCPSLKRDIAAGTLQIRQVFKWSAQLALVTNEGLAGFNLPPQPNVAGHAKIILEKWADRDLKWLERKENENT